MEPPNRLRLVLPHSWTVRWILPYSGPAKLDTPAGGFLLVFGIPLEMGVKTFDGENSEELMTDLAEGW